MRSIAANDLSCDLIGQEELVASLIPPPPKAKQCCVPDVYVSWKGFLFSNGVLLHVRFLWHNHWHWVLYITSVWHIPQQIKQINRLEQVELQYLVLLSQRDLSVVMETGCESTKEVTDNIDMTNLFLISAPDSFLLFAILFVFVAHSFERLV